MRFATITLTGLSMLGLLAVSASPAPQACKLTIELTDADTGQTVPGVVRMLTTTGQPVELAGLLPRGLGVNAGQAAIHRWSVLPGKATVEVPAGKLKVEAFRGLETELAGRALDLTGKDSMTLRIPLKRFYRADEKGYRSANTHLHLMKLDRVAADRYLREVPRADGLDVLFVSYLERAIEDRDYISNRYRKEEIEAFSGDGTLFGYGEEHRHNYGPGGEGYGHVMLLDIEKLIQPVSIGPGIMKEGSDGIPMQRGIDTASDDGATIVWCHNDWGLEDVPNWLTGRLDAQNIFDGGTHGSYKNSFYRYLNAGLRVPFSTGTDWFMYDISRVYAKSALPLNVERWLKALAAGRSYITNGPLLEFQVHDRELGETVRLAEASTIRATGRAVGRVDFGRIELVRNGEVVASAPSRPQGGHFAAELSFLVEINEPAWLALRTPPPPVPNDPALQTPVPSNEFGRDLFAHTSPVYVEVAGRGVFERTVAVELLEEMQSNRTLIAEKSLFADAGERQRVLRVHDEAIARLRERLSRSQTPRGRTAAGTRER
jgi:hypothetical protein